MQRPIETAEPTKTTPPTVVVTIPVKNYQSPTPRFALLDDDEPGIVRSID